MDYAIDTNFLRLPALTQALSRAAASDRFIISDTTVLETMKNAQWESTARDSFRIIAAYPGLIFCATEESKLMNEELESGADTASLIDAGLTKNFRALLGEISAGTVGPAMSHIRNVIQLAQANLEAQQQNHTENLKSLKGARDAAKTLVKLKAYRRLLNDTQKREFRLRLAKTLAQRSIKLTASAEGKNPAIGDSLAAGRGIILRDAIGYNLLGFHWAVLGSLNGLPDDQATNELMDVRHAVIGTYCDALLTEDKGVIKTMRQDILDALDVDPLSFPDEQPTSDSETPASPTPTL